MTLIMFDDVTPSLIPSTAEAVGYYVDGRYKDGTDIAKLFPKAKLVGIAVTSTDDADVLDVETGNATIADIFPWLTRQRSKTWTGSTSKPVIYTSVSNVDSMMLTMDANKFARSDYLIWSAHYTGSAHVCGPDTCKATSTACDATQYTDSALGKSLDESECSAAFFRTDPAPDPAPAPKPSPAPAKPATVTLTINGTKLLLDAGKDYTLSVS
jgi:hypothetical protein